MRGAVRAYREGKKGINWVIGVMEKSGLRKEDVERLLEDLKAEDILKRERNSA